MGSGINMLCFSACYAIALALEVSGLWARMRAARIALLVSAIAGLAAHSWYLVHRVTEMPEAPLASQQDWYILAAWVLAILYLILKLYYSRSSMGLFFLPAVLALIGISRFATQTPLTSFQAPRVWGQVHGVLLMVGTVAVLVGFLAGLMYLIQSYRLKHKMPPGRYLKLPSLEWLEKANSQSLGIATLFVGGGFFTGVLSRLASQGEQNFVPWTDPVVVSLAAMFVWLVVAEVFRLIYPAARQGQKVAYLTIAAILFLTLVLSVVTWRDSLHMGAEIDNPDEPTQSQKTAVSTSAHTSPPTNNGGPA